MTAVGVIGMAAAFAFLAGGLALVRKAFADAAETGQQMEAAGTVPIPTHREVAAINLAEHQARAHRSCVRHGLIDPDPENQR